MNSCHLGECVEESVGRHSCRDAVLQRLLVDRAPVTAVRRVFDAVAAACAEAAKRPVSAARRSPRGPSRPVLPPEVGAKDSQ